VAPQPLPRVGHSADRAQEPHVTAVLHPVEGYRADHRDADRSPAGVQSRSYSAGLRRAERAARWPESMAMRIQIPTGVWKPAPRQPRGCFRCAVEGSNTFRPAERGTASKAGSRLEEAIVRSGRDARCGSLRRAGRHSSASGDQQVGIPAGARRSKDGEGHRRSGLEGVADDDRVGPRPQPDPPGATSGQGPETGCRRRRRRRVFRC
jgi:hypothetical protein